MAEPVEAAAGESPGAREGDRAENLFMIESGAVAIVNGDGDEDRVVAVHGHHRFLGDGS